MERIKFLENEILRHKALYYQGRPEILDHEYDSLEEELKKLDPQNSILSIVGTAPAGEKVSHESKMLSLNKTYKLDELLKWKEDYKIVSTFKIDGTSCSLIYDGEGHLSLAKTRGDGSFGENITEKVKWIPSVPKKIDLKNCEVRGEIFCSEESFFHLSDEMASLGFEKPSSQRNIVAGLIGRKESIELCRHLNFQAFELILDENLNEEVEKFKKLDTNGFVIPDYKVHTNEKSIKEVIDEAEDFMSNGDYLIDGLVFTFNRIDIHEELGETAHHPRYKMAYKFAGESKAAKIESITWQVSRNGVLTPVAEVEPIELSGAMISRVTLHNYGMVKQFGLKKNDKIEIIRSGEVIPKFLSVVESSGENYLIPETCPSCGTEILEDDIRLKCVNATCPAKIKESILYFIQKIGIDDLSSKRLEEMLSKEVIKDVADLYDLKVDDLLKLDKTKDKLAEKIYSNIQKTKNVDLATFISALGITGGAINKSEKIISAGFNTIGKFKELTVDTLSEVESFAEKSSTEFINSLASKQVLIDKLLNKGFSFKTKKVSESPVTGKKIVITGTLSKKRSDIEKHIMANGGIISKAVSKNIDLLVTNDQESNSSKAKKARELNIEMISEENLYNLIGEPS